MTKNTKTVIILLVIAALIAIVPLFSVCETPDEVLNAVEWLTSQ